MTNKRSEVVIMFDRRKAVVESAMILDEWLERIGKDHKDFSSAELDAFQDVIEKHLELIFRRGYQSAVNPNSPDNQESE